MPDNSARPRRWRAARGAAALLALSVVRVAAQGGATAEGAAAARASIVGTIVDSVRGSILAGATVFVVGTSRRTTSGTDGTFRFDSVPAGTWKLAVAHPLLDTLGFGIDSPPVDVVAGRVVAVELSTPSRSTIRAALCPRADSIRTPGLIIGRLRDADSYAPAAAAFVSLVYPEIQVSASVGVHRIWRMRKSSVTADGKYVICGLPAHAAGTLQATRGTDVTAEVPVTLKGNPFVLRSMTIGSPPGAAVAATPASGRGAAVVPAVLTGRVVGATGEPVPGAEAAVTGASAAATTSASGEFSLQSLPSGTRELVIRKVGYEPATLAVELTRREPRQVTVTLATRAQTLPIVEVKGVMETGLQRAGFLDRKKAGMGYYVTPAMIDSLRPRQLSDLLSTAPGIQVTTTDWGTQVQSTRMVALSADACVNIFVDRSPWSSIMAGDLDTAFPVGDVVAVEVYGGTSVPSEFTVPGKNCATVVVWTRTSIGRK